ncbi:hypothetical protein PV11_04111 [Exophiala sideris]|uniref:Uncharacterized protein n=1 Tax=Exophiala sideris TaxID=1016849 RepID=A0A0D1VZW5_9EURO|nr:hypothetical protein PV11_04111 [Exophiala sideris]
MIIGGSLSYTIDADTTSSNIYDYSVLLAPGCGSTLQSGYSIAAAKVKLEEVVAAIGFIHIGQLGSAVVALNITGSVSKTLAFDNLKVALVDHHFTAAELRGAIAGTQSVILPTGRRESQADGDSSYHQSHGQSVGACHCGRCGVGGQRHLHEEGEIVRVHGSRNPRLVICAEG